MLAKVSLLLGHIMAGQPVWITIIEVRVLNFKQKHLSCTVLFAFLFPRKIEATWLVVQLYLGRNTPGSKDSGPSLALPSRVCIV